MEPYSAFAPFVAFAGAPIFRGMVFDVPARMGLQAMETLKSGRHVANIRAFSAETPSKQMFAARL